MIGRIVEYKILSSSGIGERRRIENLVILVNQAIAEGWEPIGGVAAHADEGAHPYFWQAIVKREGNSDSN
ncbi:MAG TPA: hypothetical protein VJU77_09945 [Chthoniobacterales bacterium]|nr:hypothetical protein [Chthoniobacterales bacterium]